MNDPGRLIVGELTRTALSASQRLVIECIRRALGTEATQCEPGITWNSGDWDRAVEIALGQDIAPIVYSGLPESEGVPDRARARLRAASAEALILNKSVLEPTISAALEALDAKGLYPVVLKGAALAAITYPRTAMRTFVDLDVLLSREQATEASAILQELGFWVYQENADPTYELAPLFRGRWPVSVDLHFDLLPHPNPYAVDLDQLWSRRLPATICGVPCHILSPMDALHHTCLHFAYNHSYRSAPLRHLVDILALTSRHGNEIDWEELVKLVSEARTAGAVFWPLAFARAWLGAPIPDSVLSRLAPGKIARRFISQVDPGYILCGDEPAGNGVLYSALLSFAVYQGCSTRTQWSGLFSRFFPAATGVGHLAPEVTGSRLRYAAYLLAPARVGRGITALGRLVAALPRR